MRHRTVQFLLALIASLLLVLLCLPFSSSLRPLAQGNETDQRQTLDLLVQERFAVTRLKQLEQTSAVILMTETRLVPLVTKQQQTYIAIQNYTLTAL